VCGPQRRSAVRKATAVPASGPSAAAADGVDVPPEPWL